MTNYTLKVLLTDGTEIVLSDGDKVHILPDEHEFSFIKSDGGKRQIVLTVSKDKFLYAELIDPK